MGRGERYQVYAQRERGKEHLHSLVRNDPVSSTGHELPYDITRRIYFHTTQDILGPCDAPKVGRVPHVAQVDMASPTAATCSALGARSASSAVARQLLCAAALVLEDPEAERGAPGTCKGSGLGLEIWVVVGVLDQNLVENGEESRVFLEGLRGRWEGGRCPDSEGLRRRARVEIREEAYCRGWVIGEDFL